MRYFKYPHTKKANKTAKEIYKAELAAFDERGKKLLRKEKFWDIASTVAGWTSGIAVSVLLWYLARSFHLPETEILFVNIVHAIVEVVFTVAMVFVSIILAVTAAFLAAAPFAKLQKPATKELKSIRRARLHEITRKATEHLRAFYGLREPYIVTKCYASSDRKFKNKDVCIFERDGEIRIMRFLDNALNLGECDIGCYAFESGEISLAYTEYKGKIAAELAVGETKFTLAARAKPFMEKLMKYEEKGIFLPMSQKKSGTSAYYEFQYCKKDLPTDVLVKEGYGYWQEDSLIVYIDDDARLFEHYLSYLSPTHAPNGTKEFCYFGVNYYTKEETAKILKRLEKDKPPYSEPLIKWLAGAAEEYNGFFFLGI